MENKFFLTLAEKILLETGIIVEKIQYSTVQKFILEKSRLKNITEEEVVKNILLDKAEFEQLVGAVTINETYFFREEKQFLFLKDVLFPKFYGKKIKTEFLKKLRNQKNFKKLEGLKSQPEYDKETAMRLAAVQPK